MDHSGPIRLWRWRILLGWLLLHLLVGALPARGQLTPSAVPAWGPLYTPAPLFRQHPLLQGIVAWWRVVPGLDGGPTWYDLIGRSHGTLTAMTTGFGWTRTLRGGGDGEMTCDSTGLAYVELGLPTVLNITGPVSVVAWVRPDVVNNSPSGKALLSGGSNASPDQAFGILIGRTNGELTVRWGDFDILTTSGTALVAGVPHHVAMTRAGSSGSWTATLYIDGKQSATTTTANNPASVTDRFAICRRGGASGYLAGAVDDLAVFGRPLSATEVRTWAESSRQGHPGLLRRQSFLFPRGGVIVKRGSLMPFFWK